MVMMHPCFLFTLAILVTSVYGVSIVFPEPGTTESAEGLHKLAWTSDNTDPAFMDIQVSSLDSPSILTLIASQVSVQSLQLIFSQSLPAMYLPTSDITADGSNNAVFLCTEVNNPNSVLAQSGPINIVPGDNPLAATVSGAPSGSVISVFTATGLTGSIPVSTETNAVLTSSFSTVATVVSSAVTSVSTVSLLTTTSTLYSSVVGLASTGSVLVPATEGNPQFPFITHPPVYTIVPFKKWKRVMAADPATIPFGAVTISGTRGLAQTPTTPVTTVIPGTTISAVGTTITSQPPVQSTFTPPPVTITLSPSTVVVPPTIVTITSTPKNQTVFHSSVVVVPPAASPFPPHKVTPPVVTQTLGPSSRKTTVTISSVPAQPVVGGECAICTSGLINAGHRLAMDHAGWVLATVGVVVVFAIIGLG